MDFRLLWLSFCILALILLSWFGKPAHAIREKETDRLVLLEIKSRITEDPLGFLSSWNESIHFCQWPGVTCSRRHQQRVTVLNLQAQKLAGSISPHIGNLSFLRELRLYNNKFNQQIPPEIGRLFRLERLHLDNNSFSGQIPANISGCSSLYTITANFNQFVGKIPQQLGSLSKLQILVVPGNNLTGEIPPSFGNLSSQVRFSAASNQLGGSIPDVLGQLRHLRMLTLGDNRLSGTIPSSIYNKSSIEHLDLSANQIQGSLPFDLGVTLPNLQYFGIAINQIYGSIPVSISNVSSLLRFQIANNKITGSIPSLEKMHKLQWLSISTNSLGSGGGANDLSFLCSLTNSTSLELVAINDNNFGGLLPECIGNFSTTLSVLAVDNNEIFGTIPIGMGNLVNLQSLIMFNNRLSGSIPPSIGNLQKLVELIFNGNKFSGNIPSSIGNLKLLNQLHLRDNNLQGNIPSSLGECKNLVALDLSENNFSGTIPQQVAQLSSLSIFLDLSHNHLSGVLPMEFGTLNNLGDLDVSENMLSGEIPSGLSSCVRLEILNMQGNLFQGTIPSSLKSLRGIQRLDFSRNNLSGEIPDFLESFKSLQILNLSYNNFEGMVPVEGTFRNANAILIMGNNKLCGGIPEFQLPKCNFKQPKKRKLTPNLKFIVSIASGLLLTFVLSVLFICFLRKRGKESALNTSENEPLKLSYQSLLKATNWFSSANLIGTGSFGSVYKGILDQDNKIIAVKVLNLARRGASKSFVAECEALRNIRHRNLVKVVTACSSVDSRGNDFKALVYEFMVNGSLEEWLHPTSSRSLSLLQRLNIAIDVACALEYLHHHCQTPLVHCDVKPSNVLLNVELTAHVSDFGLAKFLGEVDNSLPTNQFSSVGIRGSIGYTAPEYGMGSELSTYGDVYSYGILLLEMFTGKRPTNDMFKDGLNLHTYVEAALPEGVVEIADPFLLWELEEEDTSTNNASSNQISERSNRSLECLISVLETGVACSVYLANERMTISDVAAKLSSVRDQLIRAGT